MNYDQDSIDACVKLSDRYITDRLLPDKAIDVMDEVGARVHLKNINVPATITELEQKIEEVKADATLEADEKARIVESLEAAIPSDNNRKVMTEMMADPAYAEKLKSFTSEE